MTPPKLKLLIFTVTLIVIIGFALPEHNVMPVVGATNKDWNHNTFWYEPWGSSGVHKGIDIFAKKGTDLVATTSGIVIYSGGLSKGGNVVILLGAKWRLHYYAHLNSRAESSLSFVKSGDVLGTVGDSGNAKGKPAHLHYSIITLVPFLWEMTTETQGWKKMFYLDPGKFLTN